MLKLAQNECNICCCTAQGVKVSTAQSDQTIRKKIHQIFQRIAQKVTKSKKAKISTTKLNLKTQKIYIKPPLKPSNTYKKTGFETAYLGTNVINLLKQEVAQSSHYFGLLHLFTKT